METIKALLGQAKMFLSNRVNVSISMWAIILIALVLLFASCSAFSDNYPEPPKEEPPKEQPYFIENNSRSDSHSKAHASASTGDVHSTTNYNGKHETHANYFAITSPNAAVDSYGDGVACSKSTVGLGAYGGNNDAYGGFVSLTIPLGGKRCDDVARVQQQLKGWELVDKAAERVLMCEELHHRVNLKKGKDISLQMFKTFCDGIYFSHTGYKGLDKAAHKRISPHHHH